MRIFIASTVHDFRDLRSALKLWLEEYGYEVLLSEFNDFPQHPDRNSYDSCIQAIDRSDYFILLIGRRTGGWVDREKRISITRAEYQYAYQRAQQGQLNLVTLVRSELWDIREDRRALTRVLRDADLLDRELSETKRNRIANHSSKFTNDAEFVFEFLDEVRRVAEMRSAIDGNAEFPRANWIYKFSTFRDIIDALRTVLDLSGNLRQKTIRVNLMHELEVMLSELLERHDEDVFTVTRWSSHARHRLTSDIDGSSTYSGQHLTSLWMFLAFTRNLGKRLGTTALQDAIQSGEFLDFDRTSGRHIVGPIQNALLELNAQLERLCSLSTPDVFTEANEILSNRRYRNNRDQEFSIPNDRLAVSFALHDLIDNVINLARAIYRALQQNATTIEPVKIHPSSPFEPEAEVIARESVTQEYVRAWLSKS